MAGCLLVLAATPLQDQLAFCGRDSGTVIIYVDKQLTIALLQAQLDVSVCPLAGVIEQVAQQLQQVVAIEGQLQFMAR